MPKLGKLTNKGNTWAPGWHLGALWASRDTGTFAGLAYYSEVDLPFSGTSHYSALNKTSDNFRLNWMKPATWVLSGKQYLGRKFHLHGHVAYSQWSKLDRLSVTGTAIKDNPPRKTGFRDTYRVMLGAKADVSDKWQLGASVAYEQSPVDNPKHRNFISGGEGVVPVGASISYKVNKQVTLHTGYTHLFGIKGKTERLSGVALLNGYNRASADRVFFGVTVRT